MVPPHVGGSMTLDVRLYRAGISVGPRTPRDGEGLRWSALQVLGSSAGRHRGGSTMDTREFGRLGRVSALTLGGGGIAGVWGSTDRAEAVATIRAAVDAGITMLDLAPAYGVDAESERAAGEALRGSAADVMITTKVGLPDDTERDFEGRIRRSLAASLSRIGRDHLDLFLLHTQLRPRDGSPSGTNHIGWDAYRESVLPVFAQLVDEGLIRGWGITAVGHPASVLDALREAPRPDA